MKKYECVHCKKLFEHDHGFLLARTKNGEVFFHKECNKNEHIVINQVSIDFNDVVYFYKPNSNVLNRKDGPAIEYPDGSKMFYTNGLLHNLNDPAIVLSDGTTEWWEKGCFIKELVPDLSYTMKPISGSDSKLCANDDRLALESKGNLPWYHKVLLAGLSSYVLFCITIVLSGLSHDFGMANIGLISFCGCTGPLVLIGIIQYGISTGKVSLNGCY